MNISLCVDPIFQRSDRRTIYYVLVCNCHVREMTGRGPGQPSHLMSSRRHSCDLNIKMLLRFLPRFSQVRPGKKVGSWINRVNNISNLPIFTFLTQVPDPKLGLPSQPRSQHISTHQDGQQQQQEGEQTDVPTGCRGGHPR